MASGRYKRLRRGRTTIQTGTPILEANRAWARGFRTSPLTSRDTRSLSATPTTTAGVTVDEYPGLDAGESIFGFTDDPVELIVGRYGEKSTLGLYVYDLNEKAITRTLYHDERYDVSGIVRGATTGDVVGVRVAAEESQVELFDSYDSAVLRARARFADFNVNFVDQSADGKRTLLRVSSARDPGALLLWQSDTELFTQIAQFGPTCLLKSSAIRPASGYAARGTKHHPGISDSAAIGDQHGRT